MEKISVAKKSWHASFSANSFAVEKNDKAPHLLGQIISLSKSTLPKKFCSCKLCFNDDFQLASIVQKK